VSANPDMPQNVCNKCISKLQSIENFIANCIETENMLLRLLPNKQIRIKTEIVEPDEVEPMDTCMLELIKNEVQECDVTTDEWNIDPKHMQEFCKNTSQTETECTNENDSSVNIDVSLKDQYLSEACSIKTESIDATYDWENRSSNIDDVKNHNYSDTLNNQGKHDVEGCRRAWAVGKEFYVSTLSEEEVTDIMESFTDEEYVDDVDSDPNYKCDEITP
ncbi:uncharacterized protein, partial [Diabrotica undecimpunctata]|uniref:uncharacterized protein n=1 Tax=Diabrotica undecimpunctata TaxID=50387 RepID=UPI003B63E10A